VVSRLVRSLADDALRGAKDDPGGAGGGADGPVIDLDATFG
jgi:hypothetical protein